jgi:hypothetical protein
LVGIQARLGALKWVSQANDWSSEYELRNLTSSLNLSSPWHASQLPDVQVTIRVGVVISFEMEVEDKSGSNVQPEIAAKELVFTRGMETNNVVLIGNSK